MLHPDNYIYVEVDDKSNIGPDNIDRDEDEKNDENSRLIKIDNNNQGSIIKNGNLFLTIIFNYYH